VICSVRCITFTTDFGTQDWFVGTMKGVVQSLAPRTNSVDLTHEIPPGDIRAGAFALAVSYAFFPRDTIHVAIVDPGVGTSRGAIAVRTDHYVFLGPDNGVLSWALSRERVRAVHTLENRRYFLPEVSSTFHGRDVFAPVAARLSTGFPLKELGPARADFIRLDWPEPTLSRRGIQGEVLYIDRFGNAITNIAARHLTSLPRNPTIFLRKKRLCAVAATYQSVPFGSPVAMVGSSGFLEIAIHGGSAAQRLRLRRGMRIDVRNRLPDPSRSTTNRR
jgi:S-adenosylmethionine hydrolase